MKSTLTTFIMLLLCISLSGAVTPEKSLKVNSSSFITFIKNDKNANILLANIRGTAFVVDNESATQVFDPIVKKLTINEFPVSRTETATIVVDKKNPVYDESTEVIRYTKYGIIKSPVPQVSSYAGTIAGEPDSKVFVTYSSGKMYSRIIRKDGSDFVIAPSSVKEEFSSNNYHMIAEAEMDDPDMKLNQVYCGTSDNFTGLPDNVNISKMRSESLQTTKLIVVPISVEGTYDFYEMMGYDHNQAVAYMAAVISQVSRIYEEYGNITFNIKKFYIWEDVDQDPYYSSTSTLSDKLQMMAKTWDKYHSNWEGAIGVMFADLSKQPSNITIAGIAYKGEAYTGTLCKHDEYGGFAVLGIKKDGVGKYPTVGYTWDVNVAAHEMGHTFGLSHTHSCYWDPPIDTCITINHPPETDACLNGFPVPRRGTIMSYCHLTNSYNGVSFEFHPREIPLLRTAAEKAKCGYEMDKPYLHLLNPLGDSTLKSGKTVKIRWTYSKISSINIKYSSDNGNSWNEIANNVNAADSIYNWVVPNITTTKALMLIQNSQDPTVADTSVNNFSIKIASIKIVVPEFGDQFSQNEKLNVEWLAENTDGVTVEFSTDNGNSWNTIIEKSFSSVVTWNIPEISSSDCLIRIKDFVSNDIFAISPKFSVGVASASMDNPKAGDTICLGYENHLFFRYSNLSSMVVWYSYDSAKTWSKVTASAFSPKKGYFSLNVPANPATNTVFLKIVAGFKKELVLDSLTQPVVLGNCIPDLQVENGMPDNDNQFIGSIRPNPSDGHTVILLENKEEREAEIYMAVYDVMGNVVFDLGSSSLKPGSNNISVDLTALSAGNYFIQMRTSNKTLAYPLKIVR